ncbi:unnamed protein product [Caenorhabditis angaria]|uniref:Uncharacterized protein n=1 Tax=Caenorhabditis angaria TaxID=860376 RepID=A0A9P1IVU1_9PELO|nr:unnamed protein product [Caenorhabditis angaria]
MADLFFVIVAVAIFFLLCCTLCKGDCMREKTRTSHVFLPAPQNIVVPRPEPVIYYQAPPPPPAYNVVTYATPQSYIQQESNQVCFMYLR